MFAVRAAHWLFSDKLIYEFTLLFCVFVIWRCSNKITKRIAETNFFQPSDNLQITAMVSLQEKQSFDPARMKTSEQEDVIDDSWSVLADSDYIESINYGILGPY